MKINYEEVNNGTLIDIDEIENISEYAYQWFMKNDKECLYVLKNNALIGLMTIGDVFRYYEGVTEQVMNNHFTALRYGEIEEAEAFFEKHWTIHELPVVDWRKHLIGIYSRGEVRTDQIRKGFKNRLEDAYCGKNQWLKEQIDKWFANSSTKVFGFELPTEEETLRLLTPETRREFEHHIGRNPLEIMRGFTEEESRLYWGERYVPDIGTRFAKEFQNINIKFENGMIRYGNFQGDFFTFQGGHRIVPHKHRSDKKIYLLGPCTIMGAYVSDEQTIGAYLQEYLRDTEYEVINCGTFATNNELPYLFTEKIGVNDIVIIGFTNGSSAWEEFFEHTNKKNYWGNWSDLYMELESPLDCVLDCFRHVNYKVNKIIARKIYEQLSTVKSGEKADSIQTLSSIQNYYIGWDIIYSIRQWAKENRFKNNKTIGAIVMNCNPFTKGHRFLVEWAIKQVEFLYIFVVEEDASIFPFKQRYEMVKQGIADLQGQICVLPSGKYIISKDTFSQYFEREKVIEQVVNMDYDVRIFGEVVCKEFGISKRFVGEEPLDKVTNAYNETMARILPEYQVELVILPRKEMQNGEPISVTKARSLLECGKREELEEILPDTTLRILHKTDEMDKI